MDVVIDPYLVALIAAAIVTVMFLVVRLRRRP
jgi:hypothetical protein